MYQIEISLACERCIFHFVKEVVGNQYASWESLSGFLRSIATWNLPLNDDIHMLVYTFVIWIVSLICNPLLNFVDRYGSTCPALTAEDRNLHLIQDKMWQVPIHQLL